MAGHQEAQVLLVNLSHSSLTVISVSVFILCSKVVLNAKGE